MSIDAEALRREALGQLGLAAMDPRWPGRVLALLDHLAAAEHRATRAEAQSAIRGRAVAIHRGRTRVAEAERDAARKQYDEDIAYWIAATDAAEARVKAAQDVLDWPHLDLDGDAVVHAGDIRRALDG